MPRITGLHHVSLTVSNRARSAAWYADVLGFHTVREVEDDGQRGGKTVMVLPEQQLIISLCQHRSNPGERFSEFRTGLDHVAFAVPNRAELAAWGAELDRHDVAHSEIKALFPHRRAAR